MSELSRLALKLQLVTAQRKGEIVSAAWEEFDLKNAWWTIPSHKAKNGNAGDDTDNLFVIDWRCGTSETGMNSTKLIDQSISPDRYFVNVIFELTSN